MTENSGLQNIIRGKKSPARLLIALAILSTLISVVTLQVVPITDDLYNLVYSDANRSRGEGTHVFLFIFPMIQVSLAASFFYLAHVDRLRPPKGAVIMAGSVVFLLINCWRCLNTWIAFT